jgi:hypothetical protein|tara:strand:+ start:189 stop:1058 length:870 start_codon:yes stop_codon:yes gene_type:complete
MKITKSALKRLIEEEQDVVKEATRLASREDEADAEAFGAFMDPAFEPGRLADRASGYKDPTQQRADDPRRKRRIKARAAAAEEAGDTHVPLGEPAEDIYRDPGSREYMRQLQKEINKAKRDGHISIATWREARRALRGNPGITGRTPRAMSAERARAILDAGFKHSAAAPVRESSTQGNKTMNVTKRQLKQIILEELENVLSEDYYESLGFMRKAPDIAARGLEMWLAMAPDGAIATDKNKERALKIAEEKIRELVNSPFGERAGADEINKSIELLPRKIAMAMLGGGV